MTKYLDINKLEYLNNVIELDDLIADSILELNKKGYKTSASCSGHSNIELYQFNAPLKEKQNIINMGYTIFEESDLIYSAFPSVSTYCYIKFDKEYKFKKIPNDFVAELNNKLINSIKNDYISLDYIAKRINFFDENENRKAKDQIDKEIIDTNNILLEWVNSL